MKIKNVGYSQHGEHSNYRGAVNIDKNETVEVSEAVGAYLLKEFGKDSFEVVKDKVGA